jgi:hypothetical protein
MREENNTLDRIQINEIFEEYKRVGRDLTIIENDDREANAYDVNPDDRECVPPDYGREMPIVRMMNADRRNEMRKEE